VEVFGFAPTVAEIEAIARPVSWRATRALLAAGIGLGAAPVVAIVPPHLPWALGSLIGGAVIARKRATERYTLRSLDAKCPRCGEPLSTGPGRLAATRALHCDKCGLDSILHVNGAGGGASEGAGTE
jgi:hypothetical protein